MNHDPGEIQKCLRAIPYQERAANYELISSMANQLKALMLDLEPMANRALSAEQEASKANAAMMVAKSSGDLLSGHVAKLTAALKEIAGGAKNPKKIASSALNGTQ